MHSDHPKPTTPCSILLTRSSSKSYTLDGAVGDTYLLPTKRKLVSSTDPTCPGEGGSCLSPPGLVGESHSFGDSVRCTTEQSQVVYDGVTYTSNNTTFERELGLAKVGDTHTGLSQYVVQEAKRVCEASYGADAPVNETQYASCPLKRCLYPGVGGSLCLKEISCATVPSHFTGHGIENRTRKVAIRCQWKGCVEAVTRHTFARHIREVHLGHVRGTGVHSSGNVPWRRFDVGPDRFSEMA